MRRDDLLYGIVFGTFLLVSLCMPLVFGEAVTSSVTISGAAPSVGSVTTSDNIDLSSCGTAVVFCDATITDANGWNDVDNVNATLWDSASAGEGDSDNSNTHYTNTTCRLYGGSGSTVSAECNFTLQYYANATDWVCRMYANDTTGNVDNNTATGVTVNTLRALDAENTIGFGSLAPGATSSTDVNNTVTNCGNVPIDLNLSGTNLTNASASITNISVSNVKYNVTDWNQDYTANMTALNETAAYADFSLTKRISTLSNQTTYWKINIPGSIETLVYRGTITFTAVADS